MLLAAGRAHHTIQFVSWLKVKEMTKMRGEMADCCIWYGAIVYLEGSEANYWVLLGSLCERARSLGANISWRNIVEVVITMILRCLD
jgi:hypothetical protein